MRISYRYRLYPSKSQSAKMQSILDICRELYNAALQEMRDAYKRNGVSLNYHDQRSQIPYIKEIRPECLIRTRLEYNV